MRFSRLALPMIALAVMTLFPVVGAHARVSQTRSPLEAGRVDLATADVGQDSTVEESVGTLAGTVTSSAYGRPVANASVELWHQSGGVWVKLVTLTASSSGTWSYSTPSTEPLHVRIADPTAMHSPMWIGGTSVDTATDLVPTASVVNQATTLQLAFPAEITGALFDDLTWLEIVGCKVELYGTDGVYLDSRLTDSFGEFTFGNVPPGSYNLHFVDPTGNYLPQWWDWEDLQLYATDVDISSADEYFVDGSLEPVNVPGGFHFGPVAPAPGSASDPFVGQPTKLAVTLYGTDGVPRPSQSVTLQRLAGSAWTQVSTVVLDASGTYSAVVTPTSASTTSYRFRVYDYKEGEDVYSSAYTITSHSGTTAWSVPVLGGAGASGAVVPGAVAEVRASLVNYAGAGLGGVLPILQSSLDGVNYVNEPVAVEDMSAGVYRCLVSPRKRTYYRFVFSGQGYNEASTSAPTLLVIRQTLSVPTVPKKLKAGKTFTLKGVMRPKHLSEPQSLGSVRVYKRVGKKWVYKKKTSLSLTPRDSLSCKYSARLKLPKGSYKAEVRFPTDSEHAGAVPVTKRFTVK